MSNLNRDPEWEKFKLIRDMLIGLVLFILFFIIYFFVEVF